MMKKLIIVSSVLITAGFILVAVFDFGGRSQKEEREQIAYERDMRMISEMLRLTEKPNREKISDFFNEDLKHKNLTYFRRTENSDGKEEKFFDISSPGESEDAERAVIEIYRKEEFALLFQDGIEVDFRKNEMRALGNEEMVIIASPIVAGKSWLSRIEVDGKKREFIGEIRSTNLQRSVIVNFRSIVLDSIVESYFESDMPVEGGHDLVRYNFRWSPQLNCFTEITMKRLMETDRDTVRETRAVILKEAVVEER